MSLAATPPARSAAVTRRTASLALPSADPTDDPFTCTPMDRISWFGVPVTLPVPVTVIRAAAVDAVSTAGRGPAGVCAPDGDDDGDVAAPLWLLPNANAPIS